MPLANVERLLKDAIGLDAASVGTFAIERAVLERQRACRLDASEAYWQHLCASDAERQALIEAVVVPETWFFRDPDVFKALTRVAHAWRDDRPQGVMRILSVPCSTGEEPCSIAMALVDAHVPSDRFRIDAVDVSERALAHARRGVYGKGAFRGKSLEFRERFFERSDSSYVIAESIRRQVRYERGNLLGPEAPGAGVYDVIFCRNVLIYFDRVTQSRALDMLSRLLAPNGVVFVGAAETGAVLGGRFVATRDGKVSVFRRPDTVIDRPHVPAGSPRHFPRRTAPPVRPRQITARRVSVDSAPAHAVVSASLASDTNWLDEATRLADRGRFADAVVCCERYLRQHGPSAEAFHILGVVRDANGERTAAAECYRKALYLDPSHEQTLVHLALLMEIQNNRAEAQLLRSRARRIGRESRPSRD